MVLTFKEFIERKEPHVHKDKPENLVGSLWQELGIDRNSLPDEIPTGHFDLPEQGLYFNQCIWQLVKPIGEHDMFVKVKYFDADKSNPNFVRVYTKGHDGKMAPYAGHIPDGTEFLITLNRLAEMLGLPLKASAAAAAASSGAGMGGI